MTNNLPRINVTSGTVILRCANSNCNCEFERSIKEYKKAINRGQQYFYHLRECYLGERYA